MIFLYRRNITKLIYKKEKHADQQHFVCCTLLWIKHLCLPLALLLVAQSLPILSMI